MSLLYRVSSGLLVLFALGHHFGFRRVDPRWGADAVVAAMRGTRFEVQGFSRTYWDFFTGFGLFVTVFLLFSAVLAWQLGPEWKYNPDLITEVEVTFTPDGDGTLVNLEHRDLERMGDGAPAMREAIDAPGGWSGLLELYSQAIGQ